MRAKSINRVDYYHKKNLDIEIVDMQLFFSTRPHRKIQSDFRLNFWTIIYITKGQGHHFVDFREHTYKKGDIIFIQKNQVHHFIVNDNARGYIIHINEPFFYKVPVFNSDIFLEFVDKAFGSPVLSFDITKDRANRILIELIYKEYKKPNDQLNVELIGTLLQGFIVALKGQLTSTQEVLLTKDYEHFKRYRELVEAHFTDNRNVESYADMMHVSKKTVNQATRNVVGLSAKQFIINRTILEIKRYLSQGELMNYEIADMLGFEEAANMTKFFKHYEGVSPKAFRESVKQG